MLYPRGEHVSIRRSDEYGVGFAGVQSCGSITCPHCGSKIAAERRSDIDQLVESAEAQGYQLLFGTNTISHRLGQSMEALADVVAKAWAGVTSGRGWVEDKAHFGIVGWVRVWETKYSAVTGWHVHVHYLLVVEAGSWTRSKGAVSRLESRIFGRWSTKVSTLGQKSPSTLGQDLHVVLGSEAKREFGKYLTKQMNGGSLAFELASHGTKISGMPDQVSFEPTELLDLAVAGEPQALTLWNEYELTMQGRRTIGWSRGIREMFGLGQEKTDEEIAAEEPGTVEDTVISMLGSSFVKVARVPGARAEMLAILETFGAEWLVHWLGERGVHAWIGAPDRE